MLDLKQNKGQECRAFLTMLVVTVIEHHTESCVVTIPKAV